MHKKSDPKAPGLIEPGRKGLRIYGWGLGYWICNYSTQVDRLKAEDY